MLHVFSSGRDSVEAMVTINMPKKGKKHQTDTAPEYVILENWKHLYDKTLAAGRSK